MTVASFSSMQKSSGPVRRPMILGVGGTFREHSNSERALDLALAAAAAMGAEVVRFGASKLGLPLYNPYDRDRSPDSEELVDLLDRCDSAIFSSPSYHGTVSGTVKNAIDYAEGLVDRGAPYLQDKAIGCIGCGSGWQGAVGALNTLRSIAHALRAWPTPMGVAINTSQPTFGADGRCLDTRLADQLQLVGRQVATFAWVRHKFVESAMAGASGISAICQAK
jgi:FMN reductase